MLKSELRKIFLARQKSLVTKERREKSEAISDLFFQTFDLSEIHFLHGFLPIEKFNEIDTKPIFEKIWREFPHVETLVPRVDFGTNEIENLKYTRDTALIQNQWNI